MQNKPVVGILLGDAAGIGPELVARLIANGFLQEHCRPLLIGDRRVLERAFGIVGIQAPLTVVQDTAALSWEAGIPLLDLGDQDPAQLPLGAPSPYSGLGDLHMLEAGCRLCQEGVIGGFVFAPFHKAAMRDAGCPFESEHHLMAHLFGVTGPFGEINVVDRLMSVRTTSHIPISQVSQNITVERVLRAIELGQVSAVQMGCARPRLALAALNPHCGENGLCGREELDILAPAIAAAKARGWDVSGPYSSDVLFLRAFAGDFDVVVTMYHDQGQIALKLKGFERGVTLAGGMPYPIATCAHGTALDLAGSGKASSSALEHAVTMVAQAVR